MHPSRSDANREVLVGDVERVRHLHLVEPLDDTRDAGVAVKPYLVFIARMAGIALVYLGSAALTLAALMLLGRWLFE
jgi:hypothetical protein